VVPIAVATALPGVRRLLVLVEKNPNVLSAIFEVNDAIDASFSTRVKMGQTSNVVAVAVMADGRVLFTQKEVKVTLGGCGG
jgi:sulfur-oxidizing protein SoxY